ncbi:alpha/beta hydrolase [Massilia suwonensis]|uniref:Acyl-CoA:diacylglycerol acyltransferase n=1 Tax=Massilia suwonensis TaxID=648895 RepID=A0ABW0MJ09_9BURK
MTNRRSILQAAAALAALAACAPTAAQTATTPLVIGESFTLASTVLGENRRINVYNAPASRDGTPLPVLYMPDGGLEEDFLHIAGLLQIAIASGTMRPFMLVGIENTQRRRDLTGPSTDPEDRKIAPVIGGSDAFRRFIANELMPAVRTRYRTTGETAIIGESLAGLFVVETLFVAPEMFDTYIAVDPSLWWNREGLLAKGIAQLRTASRAGKMLFVGASGEPGMPALAGRLKQVVDRASAPGLRFELAAFPEETHRTIYHPAALRALRTLFRNPPERPRSQ